jgi:small subunit ribosomal protein S8
VLNIMQTSGYVGDIERVENGRGDAYVVELRGTINRCGTVKPRHSVRRQEYEKWETRYLPARDFGLLILTTNSGVMHHYDAKDARIGGKLLAYVY